MSELDALAREFFATIDRHDLDAVADRLAADCAFAAPGFAGTRAETVIGFMAPFLAAFPDISHQVVNTLDVGDSVAIELQITGTHTEPLMGPEARFPRQDRAWTSGPPTCGMSRTGKSRPTTSISTPRR